MSAIPPPEPPPRVRLGERGKGRGGWGKRRGKTPAGGLPGSWANAACFVISSMSADWRGLAAADLLQPQQTPSLSHPTQRPLLALPGRLTRLAPAACRA